MGSSLGPCPAWAHPALFLSVPFFASTYPNRSPSRPAIVLTVPQLRPPHQSPTALTCSQSPGEKRGHREPRQHQLSEWWRWGRVSQPLNLQQMWWKAPWARQQNHHRPVRWQVSASSIWNCLDNLFSIKRGTFHNFVVFYHEIKFLKSGILVLNVKEY